MVTVKPEERDAAVVLAQAEGHTVREYLRWLIIREAREHGLLPARTPGAGEQDYQPKEATSAPAK